MHLDGNTRPCECESLCILSTAYLLICTILYCILNCGRLFPTIASCWGLTYNKLTESVPNALSSMCSLRILWGTIMHWIVEVWEPIILFFHQHTFLFFVPCHLWPTHIGVYCYLFPSSWWLAEHFSCIPQEHIWELPHGFLTSHHIWHAEAAVFVSDRKCPCTARQRRTRPNEYVNNEPILPFPILPVSFFGVISVFACTLFMHALGRECRTIRVWELMHPFHCLPPDLFHPILSPEDDTMNGHKYVLWIMLFYLVVGCLTFLHAAGA